MHVAYLSLTVCERRSVRAAGGRCSWPDLGTLVAPGGASVETMSRSRGCFCVWRHHSSDSHEIPAILDPPERAGIFVRTKRRRPSWQNSFTSIIRTYPSKGSG